MAQGVRKLVAVTGICGEVQSLEQLLGELSERGADAVAVVGDLGAPWSEADTYRAIFRAVGEGNRFAFWMPGRIDAPLDDYLRGSYNMEIAYPFLHGVHGTVALAPGDVLFAGMGGEISGDPETIRAEEALVRYAPWEVDYRLKVIREFDVDEHLAIVGGQELAREELARTLVVCPGRLDHGDSAVVDLATGSVEAATLALRAAV